MKNPVLIFWITLAVSGSVAYGSWLAWRNTRHPAIPVTASKVVAQVTGDAPTIDQFTLTERSGRKFDSGDLKGKVWLGSFFFSACPGSCWQLNQALRGVQDEIQDPSLRVVSITCDPETDTPKTLQEYADRLQADRGRWLFLTGDLEYIKRLGREVFKQPVERAMHSNSALVIDRDGQIRGSFDMLDAAKVAEAKSLVRQLLDAQ